MNISDRIQRYRKACGLTQGQLAEAVGVVAQVVSDWESDVTRPDFGNLIALSRVFGVSTDSLLVGIEAPPPSSVVGPPLVEATKLEEEDVISEDEELDQLAFEFVLTGSEDDVVPIYKSRRSRKNTVLALAVGILAVAGGLAAVKAVKQKKK
ncbi:MAG: helix-turn-helix domain-containing protein [Oscillospiraceae bacterium]|nr:helix-turn-helix domain-containing protein [Oscillospiraceae bacterium]